MMSSCNAPVERVSQTSDRGEKIRQFACNGHLNMDSIIDDAIDEAEDASSSPAAAAHKGQ